jgi:hypothetical protein
MERLIAFFEYITRAMQISRIYSYPLDTVPLFDNNYYIQIKETPFAEWRVCLPNLWSGGEGTLACG